MFKFIKSIYKVEDLKKIDSEKEVCFLGRSNVGKSSLINVLLKQKNVAKVSKKPGKTQSINFYGENKKMIVDLPGYGFASVSKSKLKQLNLLLDGYFKNRSKLKTSFLLVDAKVGFTKDDLEAVKFLKKVPTNFILVLTKIDKALQKQKFLTLKMAKKFSDFIIETSSLKNKGIDKLRKTVNKIFEN